MRADRLLSIVLLLQSRGRLTAGRSGTQTLPWLGTLYAMAQRPISKGVKMATDSFRSARFTVP